MICFFDGRIRSLLLTLFVAGALAACGGSDSPTDPDGEDPIASVTVSPATDDVDIGGSTTLTASVLTEGGVNVTSSTTITWTSLSTSVASVSGSGSTGTVQGLAAGLAEIRASAGGVTGSAQVTVNPDPPTITTTSLADGQVGEDYAETLAASGGDGTVLWSVSAGDLPDGLELNASTGEIAGLPTSAGTFDFTVQATSAGLSDDQPLSILVAPAPGGATNVVVNVDFMNSVLPQFGDEVYVGDDGVFSSPGGTFWNPADAFTSLTDALDEFGDPTAVDMVENVSGAVFVGAAVNELQDNGIISGGLPETGFSWRGLVAGGVYDLAFYVLAEVSTEHWTTFDVTHAGGTSRLGPNGEPTWALPGAEGDDYLLLLDVSPYEIAPGVWGFSIDNFDPDGEGAILGAQLRGPEESP